MSSLLYFLSQGKALEGIQSQCSNIINIAEWSINKRRVWKHWQNAPSNLVPDDHGGHRAELQVAVRRWLCRVFACTSPLLLCEDNFSLASIF
jgi:hypothetical protein